MTALLGNRIISTIIPLLLVPALLAAAWLSLIVGIALGMIVLLFGLAATGYTVVKKNRQAVLQGTVTRRAAVRNVCLEIGGVLLAMTAAALLGRSLAEAAARPIVHELARLVAGIGVGLLVGMAVGMSIQWISSRLVRISSGS